MSVLISKRNSASPVISSNCQTASVMPSHLNRVRESFASLLYEPWSLKEWKYMSKVANSTLKSLGFKKAAALTSTLKNGTRVEGIYQNLVKEGVQLEWAPDFLSYLSTHKGQRKFIKNSWAIATLAEMLAVGGYATGFISAKTYAMISLAQNLSKCAKQILAVNHSMIIAAKAVEKPQSEKSTVWGYSSLRGLLKATVILSKVCDQNKGFCTAATIATGAISLTKRKTLVPEKKKLKALKAQELTRLTKVDSLTSQETINYRQVCLMAAHTLMFLLLISEIYFQHVYE